VSPVHFLQCGWWGGMGHEPGLGGLRSRASDPEPRELHSPRGGDRDRAVRHSNRHRDRSGAPAAIGLISRVLLALAAGIARLPRRLRAWLGRRLGDAAFVLLAGRRRMALTNIESA